MSTADTNNIGIKLQAAGENLNTWGDPNLNNDLIVLSNLASKWNAITINSDYSVASNSSNYSTTNPDEVAFIKLVGGTIAAAFNFTLAGRPKRLVVWNATSYAATLKFAATSGFSLPASRIAMVATDGSTDVYNVTPNYGGVTSPTTGSVDIPAWSAVEAAIAAAGLPATAGTILVDGTDTTAGYIASKLSITGSGAATVTPSITNPGGNETRAYSVAVGALALTVGTPISATGTTAVVNTRYQVDKSTSYTITMPAAPTAGDVVQFECYGTGGLLTFDLNSLKYYGSTTNPATSGEGVQTFIYTTASRGWIDA